MKKTKQHYYSDNQKVEKDGYGNTACGRKGRDIGGLIAWFFKKVKEKDRCKVCNKIFKREYNKKND